MNNPRLTPDRSRDRGENIRVPCAQQIANTGREQHGDPDELTPPEIETIVDALPVIAGMRRLR